MLKLIFLTIILYIIIQHFIEDNDNILLEMNKESLNTGNTGNTSNMGNMGNMGNTGNTGITGNIEQSRTLFESTQNRAGVISINNPPKILLEATPQLIHVGTKPSVIHTDTKSQIPMNTIGVYDKQKLEPVINNEPKIIEFNKPNPWTKIVIIPLEEFPYHFHIKAKVPSLTDFENWKNVIPNINFDPRTGELIIPSKDEPSALALANLILINFSGQMSLDNILEKNLIQISIAKAKSYEMVQTKLRDQIIENIYGNQNKSVKTTYEQDLSKKNTVDNCASQNVNNNMVNFKSDSFVDTFNNFSNESNESNENNENNESNEIGAWDGNDLSYL
jgi:hypothetical protein